MAWRQRLVLATVLLVVALAGVSAVVPGMWERLYYGVQGFTVGAPTATWPVRDTLAESTGGIRVAVVGDPGTGSSDEYAVTRMMAAQHRAPENLSKAYVLLGATHRAGTPATPWCFSATYLSRRGAAYARADRR